MLAYHDREVVVIETPDGPVEIRFCCRDESRPRIGIDAPSTVRILRRDGEREWCAPLPPVERGEIPVNADPEPDPASASLGIARPSHAVPLLADIDDGDWWRHPDDAHTGISGAGVPVDPAPRCARPLA